MGVPIGTVVGRVSVAGLVEKVATPQNRRAVNIALTPEGQALLEQAPLGPLREAIGELTRSDQDALATQLNGLVLRLLARRDGHTYLKAVNGNVED